MYAPNTVNTVKYNYCVLTHSVFVCDTYFHYKYWLFFTMAHQPVVGQDLHIEASRLHSDTTQTVRPLWTSDHPDPETCTWQIITQETEIRAPGDMRTR